MANADPKPCTGKFGAWFGHHFKRFIVKKTPPPVADVNAVVDRQEFDFDADEICSIMEKLTVVESTILCKRCGSPPANLNDDDVRQAWYKGLGRGQEKRA